MILMDEQHSSLFAELEARLAAIRAGWCSWLSADFNSTAATCATPAYGAA